MEVQGPFREMIAEVHGARKLPWTFRKKFQNFFSSYLTQEDMSRLGRDYLKVGFYTEVLFVEKGVRFIAINNGIDSQNQQDSDFTPFLNIINEWYAKDTSKKIRAVMKSKGESGEYLCTNPPYGYLKDPDNKKRWIVDEEAAKVVEDIFSLCVAGNGPSQIARILKNQQVDTPTIHYQKIGKPIKNCLPMNDYDWDQKTVSEILERSEYLGHTVNFKTHRQSYKIKKAVDNPKEQWRIFPNTHEPIVDEETFNRVQELRKNKRRPTRTGKINMFSGIVRCADCRAKMYYCTTNNFEKRQDYLEMTELTPVILNDLVKAVYVHKSKKVNGKRVVDIDISYDFVGILPKSLFEEMKNEPMQ